MAITIKELAEICNVSRGTVDRALNGRPGISSATRERIQQVAREYHYRPHLIASSLSRGKSMSIGVVVFDLKNRFFSQMSNAISLTARSHGYFTYVSVTEKDIESERQILHNLASRRVDGLIMLPITQGKTYIRELKELEIPIVTVGNQLPGIPHVSINEFEAAYASAEYISRAGYRRICFVCPPLRKKGAQNGRLNIVSQDQRAQGFLRFMEKKREMKHEILMEKDFSPVAASMVRNGKEKTAFFCSSDVYALELLKSFRQMGISVPRDAGLMGFDNLDILTFISPRITTVSTSIEEVGKQSMETLLRLIVGEKVRKTSYVPYQICPGDTI
ncbi:MAG: LacI family transcriptional regulator [Treponema sp.]|jgi:DNA-binding LacI/PurR family transcriptional regulator|nr:LacI family transcriptional regulator [Treponema sp.]